MKPYPPILGLNLSWASEEVSSQDLAYMFTAIKDNLTLDDFFDVGPGSILQ